MNKRILFSIVWILFAYNLLAQSPYVFDSERWAKLKTFGGTARYMALGGAGTALGADLGSAQTNPAGLGLCRKSVFAFSPDFGAATTNSSYLGNSSSDVKGSFGFDNIGAIFCSNKSDATTDNWKGGSFAVNITRMATFHNRTSIKGVNQNSSVLDNFVDRNYGNNFENFYDSDFNVVSLDGLIFDSYLMDLAGSSNNQYQHYLNDDVVEQEDNITTRGRIWQMDFAYGANYKDNLYLGAAIGFTNLRYIYERSYSETVGFIFNNQFNASTDTISSFTLDDYLKVSGSGINFKVGMIAKPNDIVRIGINLQTPTYYYSMKDNYSSSLSAQFDGFTTIGTTTLSSYENSTPEGEFRYTYTAPARASVGIAVFANKSGFISGEVEYVPYNMASFGSFNSDFRSYFNETNKDIRTDFKAAVNYKAGAEIRLGSVKLRAGMNVISDPYKQVANSVRQNLYQFSGGLGFKLDAMTIDLAVVNARSKGVYAPYTYGSATPEATTTTSQTNFVITTGFFFD